jgi:hypothetical protein
MVNYKEKNIISSSQIRSRQNTRGIIGGAMSKGKSRKVVIWLRIGYDFVVE